MAIYLKIEKQPENITELLKQLFRSVHNQLDFLGKSSNQYITNVETYADVDCSIVQCGKGKFRSFEDIKEIIQTYFPETDDLTILHALLTVEIKSSDGNILLPRMLMCNAIQKPTIYYSTKFEDYYNGGTFTNAKGTASIYTWKELLNKIGITNFEELKTYIDKHSKKEELILT